VPAKLLAAIQSGPIKQLVHHFVDNVLTNFLPKVIPYGRRRHALRLHCHLENCRVRFLNASEQFSIENQIVHLPHPALSTDLAPSDFWFFGHMKAALAGQVFDQLEELLEAITIVLEEI
jgi:hypothetical protein